MVLLALGDFGGILQSQHVRIVIFFPVYVVRMLIALREKTRVVR